MRSQFWWRWQVIATSAAVLLGLGFLFWPDFTFSTYNMLFFGTSDANGLFVPEIEQYVKFVYQILGAVLLGWSMLLYAVFYRVFIKQDRWAWIAAIVSLVIWYLPDTYFSVKLGYPANAVMNTALLVVLGIPLLMNTRQFLGQEARTPPNFR